MQRESARKLPYVVLGHPEKPLSSTHFWIQSITAPTPEKAQAEFARRFPSLPVARGQVFAQEAYFSPRRGKPLFEWPKKLQKFYVKAVSRSVGTRTTHAHFDLFAAENARHAIEIAKTKVGNVVEAAAWKNFSAFRAKARPLAKFNRR